MDADPLDDDLASVAGQEAVKDWPPLTDEQVQDLAVIFAPSVEPVRRAS
jgi:hypothetical protein